MFLKLSVLFDFIFLSDFFALTLYDPRQAPRAIDALNEFWIRKYTRTNCGMGITTSLPGIRQHAVCIIP